MERRNGFRCTHGFTPCCLPNSFNPCWPNSVVSLPPHPRPHPRLPLVRAAAVRQAAALSADSLLMPAMHPPPADDAGAELAVAVEEPGGVQRLLCYAVA